MPPKLAIGVKDYVRRRPLKPSSSMSISEADAASSEKELALALSFRDIQKLVTENENLRRSIAALKNVPAGALIGSDSAQQAIAAPEKSVNAIRARIEALRDQLPTSIRISANSAIKAQEVFPLPELLENLLLYCSPRTILRVQQVGRVCRDTINDSCKIRRKLGWEGDEKAKCISIVAEQRWRSCVAWR